MQFRRLVSPRLLSAFRLRYQRGIRFIRLQRILFTKSRYACLFRRPVLKYGGGLSFASITVTIPVPICSKCKEMKSPGTDYCQHCETHTHNIVISADTPECQTISSCSFSYDQTRDIMFRKKYNPTNIGGDRCAHGIAIEGGFVDSFNQDAKKRGAPVEAYQVPSKKGEIGTPDIEIRCTKTNKVLKRFQSKNNKDAKAALRAYNDPNKGYKEKGQVLITNEENAAKGVGKSKISCKVKPSVKSAAANAAAFGGITSAIDGMLDGDDAETIVKDAAIGAAFGAGMGVVSSVVDSEPTMMAISTAAQLGHAVYQYDGTKEGQERVAEGILRTELNVINSVAASQAAGFVGGLFAPCPPVAVGASAVVFGITYWCGNKVADEGIKKLKNA